MKPLDTAKHLADAAIQSAKQCLSTRAALRQARIDEQNEMEKERVRLEKEKAAQEVKEKKKVAKEIEQGRKREAAAAKKQAKAEQKRKEKEQAAAEDNGPKKKDTERRRGRGADELVDGDDPPCLTNRFVCAEIPTIDDMEAFAAFLVHGVPVLWKARKPPMKKVIEQHGEITDKKELANAATLIASEWKAFLSNLAEEAAVDSSLKKKNKSCTLELQGFRDALTLDSQVQAFLEKEIAEPTTSFDPRLVMQRGVLKEYMAEFTAAPELQAIDEESRKRMQQEISMYDVFHLVGMPKGQSFAGTFGGLFPHLYYQLEGTKAVSMVSAADASWLLRSQGKEKCT